MTPSRGSFFRKAIGFEEASLVRRFETRDIVRRLGVIAPNRVYMNNYPISNPIAVFNAAIAVSGDDAMIFARVIIGYYLYVSAIIAIPVPLEDIYSSSVNVNYYSGQPVIYPSTRYDVWGTEDPRVYEIDGELFMTYTGRTVNYFNPSIRKERTLPVTAVRRRNYHVWEKLHAYVLPPELRRHLISDKDSFLVKMGSQYLLFHRPHMDDEVFYLAVSRVPLRSLEGGGGQRDPIEVIVEDTQWIAPPAPFEDKIGWATPPVKLSENRVVALVHGVDRELNVYRLYAMQLRLDSEGMVVEAVTPTYIMEPKKLYEIFGDRPYTIFPCGLWQVDESRLLITYGAGDFMVGIGEIDLDELLGLLDRGRIF